MDICVNKCLSLWATNSIMYVVMHNTIIELGANLGLSKSYCLQTNITRGKTSIKK